MKGIDYTDGNLKGSVIKEHGYDFVGRYLSYSTWKNITKKEYDDLKDNGLFVVLVWETTTQRTLSGYTGGRSDAQAASTLADSIGFPRNKPIYFAVDNDMTLDELSKEVGEYFRGVGSILPVSCVGVYGGLQTVEFILNNNLASYAWQTVAWSDGKWDSRAQIQQYNTDTNTVGGVDCDLNRSTFSDFGQG